jgi:hypothetical protein
MCVAMINMTDWNLVGVIVFALQPRFAPMRVRSMVKM